MKVEDVNKLIKQFETTKKMVRSIKQKKGTKRRMNFGMPPGMF